MAKKKPADEPVSPTPTVVSLKLDWHVGKEIVGRYATQLVVQCLESECYLSFFEVVPPMIVVNSPETLQQVKEMKTLTAECVARVIIPLNKVPEVCGAIKEAYEKRTSGTVALSLPSPTGASTSLVSTPKGGD